MTKPGFQTQKERHRDAIAAIHVSPKSTSNQSSKPCTVLQYPSRIAAIHVSRTEQNIQVYLLLFMSLSLPPTPSLFVSHHLPVCCLWVVLVQGMWFLSVVLYDLFVVVLQHTQQYCSAPCSTPCSTPCDTRVRLGVYIHTATHTATHTAVHTAAHIAAHTATHTAAREQV